MNNFLSVFKKRPRHLIFCLVFMSLFVVNTINAQNAYVGEIRMFAGNFAPKGWALCNGQTLNITQFVALYSLLGVNYGGDGFTTFNLPNLNGRFALGTDNNHPVGMEAGNESVTILPPNLPAHNHPLNVFNGKGNTDDPTNATLATGQTPDLAPVSMPYSTNPPNATLNMQTVGLTGGSVPIAIMPPYTAVTFIICLDGAFPPRQ